MGKLYFNTEEQLLLNSLCINESKESALKQLDFSINLCKDNELIEVMSDLKNKLLNYISSTIIIPYILQKTSKNFKKLLKIDFSG